MVQYEYLERVLSPAEFKQHATLVRFLEVPAPMPNDPARPGHVKTNLIHQEWVSDVKSKLVYQSIALRSSLYVEEAKLRDEARVEKIRTAEERAVALHGNAKYRDLWTKVEELKLAIERLVTLEWILRSSIK